MHYLIFSAMYNMVKVSEERNSFVQAEWTTGKHQAQYEMIKDDFQLFLMQNYAGGPIINKLSWDPCITIISLNGYLVQFDFIYREN